MGHAHQNYIDLIFANDGNRGWAYFFHMALQPPFP